MTRGRSFIVSTRPIGKFSLPDTDCCFSLVNVPVTRISDIELGPDILTEINDFSPDSVVFTSERGAAIFFSRVYASLDDGPAVFYGVGRSTCREVESAGFSCNMPVRRDSVGLADLISKEEKGRSVLLFRSGQANKSLDLRLSREGIVHMSVNAYDVEFINDFPIEPFLSPECFGVIFTSAMEVRSVFGKMDSLKRDVFNRKKMFSIGHFTTKALTSFGIDVSEPFGKSDFSELFGKICVEFC